MSSNEMKQNETLLAKQEQAILIIASRLLDYPSDEMDELLQDIDECIKEEITSEQVARELENTRKLLSQYALKDLQELYVSTFDLKSKLGLYLTAHEFGDSPKRGAALIKLQKTVNQSGYERIDNDLADFIPMLLELMSVAPESAEHIRLYKRLSLALHRMLNNIHEDNPYTSILRILITHVFPNPTKEEIDELENNREEADLEDLPFPIMYQ